MAFRNKTLRKLTICAGLWLTSTAAFAAPQGQATMATGMAALPPRGYVAFCERQPQDCGPDVAMVLSQVEAARSDRARLSVAWTPDQAAAASAPAALASPLAARASWGAAPVSAAPALLPVDEPMSAVIERAAVQHQVAFIDPTQPQPLPGDPAPALTPQLWSRLNDINARVNRAIGSRTDLANFGRADWWATPLGDGQAFGDCEDYVLEKRRALIAAGLSPRGLNIALVTTAWGESHAVLLVATSKGEFVLDNLSPIVRPWDKAPLRWRQRQVNGEAFNWVMVDQPVRSAGDRGFRMAALR